MFKYSFRVNELSSKKVYSKLLQSNSAGPISSHHWAPFVRPAFQLSEHWSLVRDNFTENHKNDLLWLILLHAVKVRDSLKNWGVIGSGVCACCPRLETIAHCFLNCARIKRVWDYFSPLLSSLLGIQFDVNIPTAFLFAWPSPCYKISRIARFLIKSVLYGIWCFRNKATFFNYVVNHSAIIKLVICDVKCRIMLDFFPIVRESLHGLLGLPKFLYR